LSLVVECSILIELVGHGGIAHFLVVHGGKRKLPQNIILPNTQKKIVGQLRSCRRSLPGVLTRFYALLANGKVNTINTQYERIIQCPKHWATCG
jgi:hypothetical protein